jgi:uncharacterized protein
VPSRDEPPRVGNHISVRLLERKGRGVFAERRLAKGEVIEKCPVVVIPVDQVNQIHATVLTNYVYPWGEKEDEAALPLGFGVLYNHSYSPNADWFQDLDALVLSFVALRDIEVGEEITVNYNGPPDCQTPVWFDVSD